MAFDGARTVDIALEASGFYVVGTTGTVTATIYDNETIYVSNAYTTANDTVEGGQAVVGINAFDTINQGINASDGDNTTPGIVEVRAGTYNELVNIGEPVNLRGPNADIAGNAARNTEAVIGGTVGRIQWDDGAQASNDGLVTVNGFAIDGVNGQPAILTTGAGANSLITNNIIQNVTDGQGIFNGTVGNNGFNTSNLTISNNLIQTVTDTGADMVDSNGIFLLGVTNLTIQNNEIRDITGTTNRGINVSGVNGGTISGNTFNNTTEDAIQLANNLGMFPTQNVTISDNTITNANTTSNASSGGIRLRDGAFAGPVNVTGNDVSTSFNGLAIRAGTGSLANVTVSNNAFAVGGGVAITNLSGNALTATGNFSDLARTTALVDPGDINGNVTV